MLPFKKILCPIDFSEASLKTLQDAVELARHFDAALCLIHVTPEVVGIPADPIYPVIGRERYEQELEEVDKQKLVQIMNEHVPQGVTAQAIVRGGNAAEEIVRAAETEGADLIVIATHGLTGWRHLVFGSVAEKVVRLATCPVLISHRA